MKFKNLFVFILVFLPFSLWAQESIILDGRVLMKKDFDQYQSYKVDLSNIGDKLIEGNKKITSITINTSKGYNSFSQTTRYENKDPNIYDLPSSNLKFFDETGKLKWQKNWEGQIPKSTFLSPDGKYLINEMVVINSPEDADESNYLEILDDLGNLIFTETSSVKFQLSNSRDIVCYQKYVMFNNKPEDEKIIYCYDLKSKKVWSKNFENKVEVMPISSNGNYILAFSAETYTLFNRNGEEIFKRHMDLFEKYIDAISNDGKYILSIQSSATHTSYYNIYKTEDMASIKSEYFNVNETKNVKNRGYNGGSFVNNSKYILALTSIIAPSTAMIVFHDLDGKYLGHKVYDDILSSFYHPIVTLLDDGSFEIYMDGHFLGNLKLPNINALEYLDKQNDIIEIPPNDLVNSGIEPVRKSFIKVVLNPIVKVWSWFTGLF